MKKLKNRFILLIISVFAFTNCFAQLAEKRCASHEIEEKKVNKNPNFLKNKIYFNDLLNAQIGKNRASKARKSSIKELIRIPVVVHIIHNNSANTIGGARNGNITDEQIKSQITVLNEDFRRKVGTLGFNSNAIGVDMNIEFYLAENDPEGNATDGIKRVFNEKQTFDPFSDEDQQLLSTLSYWPSDCYLNLWVTSLSNNYLGFSQFPAAPNFDGLDAESDEKIDGVYIDYKYFGRNSSAITSKYYKYGRTTTHEIGHWLGLIHTWGDEDCGDDYVDDTPAAQGPNLTTVCVDKFSTCVAGFKTRNMIENYLDYTIDSCMNTFTKGQLERVSAVFELSPQRAKLVECSKRLPEAEILTLDMVPNPANNFIKGNVLFKGTANVEISIFDLKGNLIDSQIFENKKSFPISIPVHGLVRDVYILRAKALGQIFTKRMLIANNE